MKLKRSAIAAVVLSLAGILVFIHSLANQERRQRTLDTVSMGSQLVNLLSLWPLEAFASDRRGLLLTTLAQYGTQDGLAYFFVHDMTGKPIVVLAPAGVEARIPETVRMQSLTGFSLQEQRFALDQGRQTICEFAKPVYGNGSRIGTVRLGIKLPDVSLLSSGRATAMATIVLLMAAVGLLGYYGFALTIGPLKQLPRILAGDTGQDPGAGKTRWHDGITPVIADCEKAFDRVKQRLSAIESTNAELSCQLGVRSYEISQTAKILDAIPLGIVVVDSHEQIMLINRVMLQLLQRRQEQVMDRPLRQVIASQALAAFLDRLTYNGKTSDHPPLETAMDEWAPGEIFKISLTPLTDGAGESAGHILLVANVTRDVLAGKAQQEFIAHVAHELMTPLGNIRSYSEMLMDGEIEAPELQKEFYNTIAEQTIRLSELVKNLLNVSKMEMGSLTLNRALVRSDWFARDCINAIEGSCQGKSIRLIKQMPDVFPNLIGDKELLKVALINVLGNAVKYTPANGTITFAISENDKVLRFDVIDTGYGIAEEDLPHVFEKFYRSADASITEQTGSGLGLAITAEIVRLHDGDIQVHSQIGRGSHFTITVPKEDYVLTKEENAA